MNAENLISTGIGAVAGAVASAIYNSVHKNLFDTKRVTTEDCDKRHKTEAEACAACKTEIKEGHCSMIHEISAMKGIILLIAVKVGVGNDDLKSLVEHRD